MQPRLKHELVKWRERFVNDFLKYGITNHIEIENPLYHSFRLC